MRRSTLMLALAAAVAAIAYAPAQASTGLAPDVQRGANVTSWWHDEWESTSTDASLVALRATGATDAAFLTTWYMQTPSSTTVAPDALKTPSDAGLLRAMAKARALGMRVVLKPHVDVMDGSFRGDIAPSDANAWFASYRTMIDHYATLAQQAGASTLVVGTELTSM